MTRRGFRGALTAAVDTLFFGGLLGITSCMWSFRLLAGLVGPSSESESSEHVVKSTVFALLTLVRCSGGLNGLNIV